MKLIRAIKVFFILVSLISTTIYANNVVLSTPNAIPIINGKSHSFTGNINNNWYDFNLLQDSNILLLAESTSGHYATIEIYDEDLNYITRKSPGSDSIALTAGKYYITISGYYTNEGGTFTIYSKHIVNPLDPSPITGSILNPHIPQDGIELSFSPNIERNVNYFEMNSDGNILITAESTSGHYATIEIYDEDLNYITRKSPGSDSIALSASKYYLRV